MPNTREKLIELIDESRVTNTEHSVCINGSEYIADHLIANGVTVQKWIPTRERKPKEKDACNGVIVTMDYQKRIETRYWRYVASNPKEFLCWTPLPQPPKEE